jgi:hypothetical protein
LKQVGDYREDVILAIPFTIVYSIHHDASCCCPKCVVKLQVAAARQGEREKANLTAEITFECEPNLRTPTVRGRY